MEKKRTKEEKRKEHVEFIKELRALPPDKLSKAAKWILKCAENDRKVHYV